ncbi:hypothetical protein C4564_02455 [Candidatus Microgenomates bacterium]|nr:MAG: hypothetical protein C4564_02455 [Candidatus Microgenomates bacterium]
MGVEVGVDVGVGVGVGVGVVIPALIRISWSEKLATLVPSARLILSITKLAYNPFVAVPA